MSSSHRHQASRQPSRPRPTTKARHEQAPSAVPVPPKTDSRSSRKPHGKKHSARMTPPEAHEPPRRPRTQRQHDDFRSMGTWCGEIPERHYSPRISVDEWQRPHHLPRAPTPPSPRLARLQAPHPSVLAFDAEFGEPQPGDEDGQVGDAWCLSRKAKTNRQLEEALAHIARTRLLPQAE